VFFCGGFCLLICECELQTNTHAGQHSPVDDGCAPPRASPSLSICSGAFFWVWITGVEERQGSHKQRPPNANLGNSSEIVTVRKSARSQIKRLHWGKDFEILSTVTSEGGVMLL
jgi:hypothetical protein